MRGLEPALMPGTRRDRALVVELVGAAGTGKTTLAAALAAGGYGARMAPRPSRGRYAWRAVSMLPALADMHRPLRRVLFMESKRALHLAALRDVVHASRDGAYRALVFDEGPVYMLARILVFGGANVDTNGFRRWWRSTTAEWAQTLDVVVYLDASDDVLIERIRTRRQAHPVKELPAEEVRRFLDVYRRAYERVIDDLQTCGGPHVARIGADALGIESLAASALAALDGAR
jgi:thymidylate kinase